SAAPFTKLTIPVTSTPEGNERPVPKVVVPLKVTVDALLNKAAPVPFSSLRRVRSCALVLADIPVIGILVNDAPLPENAVAVTVPVTSNLVAGVTVPMPTLPV